jgi:TetR/AcrR family transcriptional repressor of nem operon
MNIKHSDVRQHILDTAKTIILGRGFSAAGLNQVLRAADVPKGSFYHYFKSKDAFGEALLDSYFDDYLAQLDLVLVQPEASAAHNLMRYWTIWLETQSSDGLEGKCLVVKLGGEVSDLSEAMRAALQRGTDSVIARLASCIERGVADGSLRDVGDPAHAAQTLYGMWLGATLLTKIRRDRSALDGAMQATRKLLNLASSISITAATTTTTTAAHKLPIPTSFTSDEEKICQTS